MRFGSALTENDVPGSAAFVAGQRLAEVIRSFAKEKADQRAAWRDGQGDREGAMPRGEARAPPEYGPGEKKMTNSK